MPSAHQKSSVHFPGMDRDADDWAVVSVNALYAAIVTAYAGKTRLRVLA